MKKDVSDMIKIKDLYALGLCIIEVLQGKTTKPKVKNQEFNADINAIPVKWLRME